VLGIFGRNSRVGVGDAHGDFAFCRANDPYLDDATGDSGPLYRFDGIARQVQHDLLNLDPVKAARWKIGRDCGFDSDGHIATFHFHQLQGIGDQLADFNLSRLRVMLFYHGPQGLQYVSCARGLRPDLVQQFLNLGCAHRTSEPSTRGERVVLDSDEWLIDLVSDRRRHRTDSVYTRQMCEIFTV